MDVKLFCRLVCFLVAVFPAFVNSNLTTEGRQMYLNDGSLVYPSEGAEVQGEYNGELKENHFMRKLNEEEEKRAVFSGRNVENTEKKHYINGDNEYVLEENTGNGNYNRNVIRRIGDKRHDQMETMDTYNDQETVEKNDDDVNHVITGNRVYGRYSGNTVNSFNSINSNGDMDLQRYQDDSKIFSRDNRNLSKSYTNMDNTDDYYNGGSNPIIGDNKQNVDNKDNSFNVNNNNNNNAGKVVKSVLRGLSNLPSMKFLSKFGA